MKRIGILGCMLIFSTQTHASQVAQKETAQHKQATPLELQMINDARDTRLTEKTLQWYIKEGVDINAKDNNGYTALMWASSNGNTAIVQQLIAAGADINAKNNYGNTALLWASRRGHTLVVKQLIAAGVSLNDKNNGGNTALMWASINGHTAVVQQLIAAGADHTIVNEYNLDNKTTARDYATDTEVYDKAVAAGLQERKEYLEYLARQPHAKKIVAEQTTHIPGLQDIIMGYAYGPSPIDLPDLPPTQTQEEEKKSDSAEAVLETSKNREEKKSNCTVQ